MSVTALTREWWRLPGCGEDCGPRLHDPYAHEQHGRRLEREARRVVRTGPLMVDLDRCVATVHGVEIDLSPREWELLAYYAARAGRWCTLDEIVSAVWQVADRGIVSTTRWRLRARLGAAGALIEAQQGRGARRSRLRLVEAQP